jgi:transcriptional regulator with XRE-family HTH domain
MDAKAIAETVLLLRVKKGLTQAELARAARVSIGTVQSCERGIRQTKIVNLNKIAQALGTSGAEVQIARGVLPPSESGHALYPPRVAALADRIAHLDPRFLTSVEAIVTTLETIPKQSLPQRVKRQRAKG